MPDQEQLQALCHSDSLQYPPQQVLLLVHWWLWWPYLRLPPPSQQLHLPRKKSCWLHCPFWQDILRNTKANEVKIEAYPPVEFLEPEASKKHSWDIPNHKHWRSTPKPNHLNCLLPFNTAYMKISYSPTNSQAAPAEWQQATMAKPKMHNFLQDQLLAGGCRCYRSRRADRVNMDQTNLHTVLSRCTSEAWSTFGKGISCCIMLYVSILII